VTVALGVLVAAAKAASVCAGVVAIGCGLRAIITDRPLNRERSTRSGDTPRHRAPQHVDPH
jgi:hypothetical protein